MFIELSPVNVDKSRKEMINLTQVFSFAENGATTFVTVLEAKGLYVEIEVSETYSEIKEKLSGVVQLK